MKNLKELPISFQKDIKKAVEILNPMEQLKYLFLVLLLMGNLIKIQI